MNASHALTNPIARSTLYPRVPSAKRVGLSRSSRPLTRAGDQPRAAASWPMRMRFLSLRGGSRLRSPASRDLFATADDNAGGERAATRGITSRVRPARPRSKPHATVDRGHKPKTYARARPTGFVIERPIGVGVSPARCLGPDLVLSPRVVSRSYQAIEASENSCRRAPSRSATAPRRRDQAGALSRSAASQRVPESWRRRAGVARPTTGA